MKDKVDIHVVKLNAMLAQAKLNLEEKVQDVSRQMISIFRGSSFGNPIQPWRSTHTKGPHMDNGLIDQVQGQMIVV